MRKATIIGAARAGRSVRRGGRGRFVSAISLALAALVAVALSTLNPLSGAKAAPQNTVQVTASIAPTPAAPNEAFFDRTVAVTLNDGGILKLASNPAGTGATVVDDMIVIDVLHEDGTTAHFEHAYQTDCTTLSGLPAQNLTSPPTAGLGLTKPGVNVIRVRLVNMCGSEGASDPIWLVVAGQATLMRATPVVVAVAPPTPPLATVYVPNLSGKLTEAATSNPIAGRLVVMRAGGPTGSTICSAITDSDGVATCGGVVEDITALRALGYTAVFAGDVNYVAASAHGPILTIGTAPLPS